MSNSIIFIIIGIIVVCVVGYIIYSSIGSSSSSNSNNKSTSSNSSSTADIVVCDGEGDYRSAKAGETVTLECPFGYIGTIDRLCNNGTWDNPVDNCEKDPTVCPATDVLPMTKTGEIVTVDCPNGYEGTMRYNCTDGVWSKVDGVCTRRKCLADDEYSESLSGRLVKMSCNDGSRGIKQRNCNLDGTWADEINACVSTVPDDDMYCPATKDSPKIKAGAYTAVKCDENSSSGSSGYKVFYCSFYKYRSQDSNYCGTESSIDDVKYCPATGAWPAPGVWPETLASSIGYAKCPLGYTGYLTRKCLADGTWAGTYDYQCRQIKCFADGSWPTTSAGGTAKLRCEDGYSGYKKRVCDINGKWSTVYDNCILGDDVVDVDADEISAYSINYCPADWGWPITGQNATAVAYCNRDNISTSASIQTRKCSSNGTWLSPDTSNCEKNLTADPNSLISNGTEGMIVINLFFRDVMYQFTVRINHIAEDYEELYNEILDDELPEKLFVFKNDTYILITGIITTNTLTIGAYAYNYYSVINNAGAVLLSNKLDRTIRRTDDILYAIVIPYSNSDVATCKSQTTTARLYPYAYLYNNDYINWCLMINAMLLFKSAVNKNLIKSLGELSTTFYIEKRVDQASYNLLATSKPYKHGLIAVDDLTENLNLDMYCNTTAKNGKGYIYEIDLRRDYTPTLQVTDAATNQTGNMFAGGNKIENDPKNSIYEQYLLTVVA